MGYYLALFRDRGDHTHHPEDLPLMVTSLPLSAFAARGSIEATLHDAAASMADFIVDHPDVLAEHA
jgi:hypothetical protein